jgi:CHAD domain-containing protein
MAHATTSIPAGLARLLRRRLLVLSKELPRARRGDVKGVHKARVASRRLREAVAAIDGGARGQVRTARRDLRRVTTALGGVREMDVAVKLLKDAAAAESWPAPAVAAVIRQCEATRDRRRKRLAAALDRVEFSKLVDAVDGIRDSLDGRAPARSAGALASRVRKRAREFQKTLAAAGTLYAPAPLHATRLAAKKLRYTLEFAREAGRMPLAADLRQLEALQALLGRLHDFQIVQEQTQAALAGAAGDRSTTRALEAFDAAIERTCRELHARFLALVPRLSRLADRISREVTLKLVARQPMARMGAPKRARAPRPPALKLRRTGTPAAGSR